jgi:hypothetical protein
VLQDSDRRRARQIDEASEPVLGLFCGERLHRGPSRTPAKWPFWPIPDWTQHGMASLSPAQLGSVVLAVRRFSAFPRPCSSVRPFGVLWGRCVCLSNLEPRGNTTRIPLVANGKRTAVEPICNPSEVDVWNVCKAELTLALWCSRHPPAILRQSSIAPCPATACVPRFHPRRNGVAPSVRRHALVPQLHERLLLLR